MPPITPAFDHAATLGESPRWHAGEGRLYWVDIDVGEVLRARPGEAVEHWSIAQPAACLAFRAGGGLLIGGKAGLLAADEWRGDLTPFGEQMLKGRDDYRLNDGRTDPAGRFWVGSMDEAKLTHDAALYRVTPAGEVTRAAGGMTTCNAAAFTADGRRFMHADTATHALRRYDVDPTTGGLSNERLFHQFERGGVGPGLGRPDGGSFDSEGCYWSALFDGWRVVRLSPGGEIVAEVALPVQRPTMIAFGGTDHRTAYVTTARKGLDEAALLEQPLAGAVLSFPVDVPGVPEFAFAG